MPRKSGAPHVGKTQSGVNKTLSTDYATISGVGCTINGNHCIVSGTRCTIYGHHCNVSGSGNIIHGHHAHVTGCGNSIYGHHGIVSGGAGNKIYGHNGQITGGSGNKNYGHNGQINSGVGNEDLSESRSNSNTSHNVNFGTIVGAMSNPPNSSMNFFGGGGGMICVNTLHMDNGTVLQVTGIRGNIITTNRNYISVDGIKITSAGKIIKGGEEFDWPMEGSISWDEILAVIESNELTVQRLEEKDDEATDNNDDACVICLENKKICIIDDCHHLALCAKCSNRILTSGKKECPVCKKAIVKGIKRVFSS